jgi:hypothetical protein
MFRLILSSHLRLGLSSDLFPSSFSAKVKNLDYIDCFDQLLLFYDDKIKKVLFDL